MGVSTIGFVVTPVFIHDSDCCTFQGTYAGHDVYTCGDTIMARYGNEGWEYASMPISLLLKYIQTDHPISGDDWRMPFNEYLFSGKAIGQHKSFILALTAIGAESLGKGK